MAKRPKIDPKEQAGLFKATGEPEPEKTDDPVRPRGVGLKASEWQRLEQIGAELGGASPHSLVLWAVRDFIRRFEAGEIQTRATKTLPDL